MNICFFLSLGNSFSKIFVVGRFGEVSRKLYKYNFKKAFYNYNKMKDILTQDKNLDCKHTLCKRCISGKLQYIKFLYIKYFK